MSAEGILTISFVSTVSGLSINTGNLAMTLNIGDDVSTEGGVAPAIAGLIDAGSLTEAQAILITNQDAVKSIYVGYIKVGDNVTPHDQEIGPGQTGVILKPASLALYVQSSATTCAYNRIIVPVAAA